MDRLGLGGTDSTRASSWSAVTAGTQTRSSAHAHGCSACRAPTLPVLAGRSATAAGPRRAGLQESWSPPAGRPHLSEGGGQTCRADGGREVLRHVRSLRISVHIVSYCWSELSSASTSQESSSRPKAR